MKLGCTILILAAAACLNGGMAPAFAADPYPLRVIKLVVGFQPGGPTDIIGRVIGQGLSKELGQSVIIENIGGASGINGARSVARAQPDGYTLLVSVESAQTRGKLLNPSLPYDQVKDFTFVKKMAKQRNLIVVNPSLPVSNIKELIAYMKENPGKLNASGTFGATSHLGITLFSILNDVKVTFVSYSGGAQPITDLMTGTVQVGVFTEATVAQYIKAGMLKALAIASYERSPAFPNLPTVGEAGGKPMEVSPWFGIAAPAGTPGNVVKALSDALDRANKNADYLKQLDTIGAVPILDSTPEKFTREVGEEIEFWTKHGAEIKASMPK